MQRRRLPARRGSENIPFEHGSQRYIATLSCFDNGDPAELFLNSEGKLGSEADITAADAAVAVSFALQYGCPIDIMRAAMKRNPDGAPQGPLGHALDLFEVEVLSTEVD